MNCPRCNKPITPATPSRLKSIGGKTERIHDACLFKKGQSLAGELRKRLEPQKEAELLTAKRGSTAPAKKGPPKPLRKLPASTPVTTVAVPVAAPEPEVNRKWLLSEKLSTRADRAGIDQAPHLVIEARAGTGKTTTLVEGLKRMRGLPTSLTPSPQQALIWEQMELSRGKAESVCFCAFNSAIAKELQTRIPSGCNAMTLHSMGLKAVNRAFPGVSIDKDGNRVPEIIAKLLEREVRELRRNDPVLLAATKQLVTLCKQNLTTPDNTGWAEELEALAAHYEVELDRYRMKVFELVPQVLERCKDVAADNAIDFDDMPWLPIALDLPCYKYDVLLVDEAQDLNRCQQALAKKSGRRIILCGDPKQAIYGFAGADVDSMRRMLQELTDTERGCRHLPLTVTRRCGKAIVAEAKRIVPDFEAHESNPEGKISKAKFDGVIVCEECRGFKEKFGEACEACEGTGREVRKLPGGGYRADVQDGDFVLCRCNAPLVSQCFKFFKEGRKAVIQGRDIGKGLIETIRRFKAGDITELIEKIENWYRKEVEKVNAQRNPSESRLISLEDRKDCLLTLCEDVATVGDVERRIESIFSDDSTTGIRLSSCHRAKGLEARRVFILLPPGASMPHPAAKSAWQRAQEMNLKYVAITRSIEELIWVS